MTLKDAKILEYLVGDKIYHFICDPTSPLNEVKDALCYFITIVNNLEAQIKANIPAPDPAATAVEPEKVACPSTAECPCEAK